MILTHNDPGRRTIPRHTPHLAQETASLQTLQGLVMIHIQTPVVQVTCLKVMVARTLDQTLAIRHIAEK
jgi:hypothetical protein